MSSQGFDLMKTGREQGKCCLPPILTARREHPQELWLGGRAVIPSLTEEAWGAGIIMK